MPRLPRVTGKDVIGVLKSILNAAGLSIEDLLALLRQ